MYGLPQAGKFQLVKQLDPHGYAPCRHTPVLWCHKWQPILFSLVVENFGVKYVGRDHAKHLMNTLQQYHTLKTDWAGTLYFGITLKWDYTCHNINLSMTEYINGALPKYQHPKPSKTLHAPYLWEKPQYGQTIQYAKPACLRHQTHPKSHRYINLLRPRHWQHHIDGNQCNISCIVWHNHHSRHCRMATRLCRHVPWCHGQIQRKPNDIPHLQQWILSVRDQIPQLRRHKFIFGITQIQWHQHKQLRHSHNQWNHQKRHVGGF